MSALRTLFLLVVSLAGGLPLAAQGKVDATLFTRVDDGVIRAAIQVEIAKDWHIYHSELGHPKAIGGPTEVTFGGDGVTWEPVQFPEPKSYDQSDLIPGAFILGHEGTIVLYAKGTVDSGTGSDVTAKIKGYVCHDSCIPFTVDVRTKGRGTDEVFASFPVMGDVAVQTEPAPTEDIYESGMADATLYTRVEDGRVRAVIQIEIDPDWHLYHDVLGPGEEYAKATTIEMRGGGVRWDKPKFPEPHQYGLGLDGDDGEELWVYGHEGTILVRAEGTLEEGATGEGLWGKVDGQTCSEEVCIDFIETIVSQGAGSDELFAGWESAVAASDEATSNEGEEGEGDDGLLWFLLSAVGWGLFTLLMPCTYPMIPITISFFTKQAESRGGNVLPLSLTYGAGIVLIFIVIGVVVGSAIIPFATHPITNLVIGALFFYFALVLFGFVTLQPPRFLMDAAGKASMKGGYTGVFLMGATLVVTSFTCTAPFVGTLLAQGASDGNLMRIVLGMTAFGLTMAFPFVFLSLVPGRIAAIPSAGQWMNTLKVFLGFVELAAALKFLSNSDLVWGWDILSREFFLLIWGVLFLAAAIYLFGFKSAVKPGGKRLAGAGLVLVFSGYCFYGMSGKPVDSVMTAIIPPYSGGKFFEQRYSVDNSWPIVVDDYDEALAMAIEKERLVLINFTGKI